MDGGTNKEETGKRKLADVDEGKDHKAEEPRWTASEGQKSRTTDLNEQASREARRSAQVLGKRHVRQANISKRSRLRATTNEAETRQEQRAGRRL